MEANIGKDGTLILVPETTTELYALHIWESKAIVAMESAELAESHFYRGSKLIIVDLI